MYALPVCDLIVIQEGNFEKAVNEIKSECIKAEEDGSVIAQYLLTE